MEKKVIDSKLYVLSLVTYDDDTTHFSRTNTGFNPIELIGLMTLAINEVTKQWAGELKPDVIERNYIKQETPAP